MKKSILAFVLLLLVTASVAVEPPRTMRVDYYHTGDFSHEKFQLDALYWNLDVAGQSGPLCGRTQSGQIPFRSPRQGHEPDSLFAGLRVNLWRMGNDDEARGMHRTFSESLRFPAPEKAVQILLKKRDARNAFGEIWTFTLDPKDIFVSSAKPAQAARVIEIERNGDSAKKLDFLILGVGYTAAESAKFEKDARRLASVFFETEPFKSRRRDFNIWALCPTSAESGISRPAEGIHRRSALGATYSAFGSERYILTFENKTFRDIASWAPYEVVEILVNDKTYGGGGIFNLYGTVAADSLWAPYIFIHEFGHHLAGLADEYYTSDVAYNPPAEKIEPWEPNATALLPGSNLKWGHLVDPGTPIPTPWNKETFEKFSLDMQARRRELRKEGRPESEINALFTEEREREERMFREEKYADKVGAFEGANYEAKGYYRPEVNCIMFTRTNYFCRVCQTAIQKVLDLYTRP
jgi:hypothetical protein